MRPIIIKLFSIALIVVLISAFLPAPRHAKAVAPAKVFISEYIEGSSFNKAIEIYNGSGVPVDLGTDLYTLELYSNGAASPSQTISLTGTVAPGDVFVLAHASADAAILAVADVTSSSVINFNGDDAVVLRKNGSVVDAFGQTGFDPGTQWAGGGLDDTLRRKATICTGDTIETDAFDASVEWDIFANNTFDGLGHHVSDCELKINEFVFNHTGTDNHEYVEVFGIPNTDYSAYTLLEIEGDFSSQGTIEGEFPVGTTDANGFWSTGFLYDEFENGTVTMLLVKDFSGSMGIDLDTDDDGTLNSTPWSAVVDSLAVSDGGASDLTYATVVLDPAFGGGYAPGGASRIPDGLDTESVTDWVLNDFDLAGIPTFTGTLGPGEALNTPGETNQVYVAPSYTDLVINEVDSDTPGTDVAEFVELFDGGVGNTPLDELVLVFYNGNGVVSYAAYDLDGYSTDANGYFLIGNSDVSPTPGIIFAGGSLQNGADAVALYIGDGSDFPDDTPLILNNLIDALVYDTDDADSAGLLVLLNAGQPQINENGAGDKDNDSNQRCPNGAGGLRNTDTYTQETPTPGAENSCAPPPPPEACGDAFTSIFDVQGSGLTSPLVGTEVSIEGIVVGDFQNNTSVDNGDLNGFHVQDPVGDGDPATSDGIFIYYPSGAEEVSLGDAVRVRGAVSEFNSMTEITVSQLWQCSTGNPLPAPATLSLPVVTVDDFEAFEGMRVTFPQDLYISEYFNYDRYGEIVLTSQRHLTPTAEFEPGPDSIQAAQDFLLDKITLDDGRSVQNPDPANHPNGLVFDMNNLFRGGDILNDVTGVMDYSFGLYRIQPTQGAVFTEANPRPAQPEDVGGHLRVSSFNMLNYFSTMDTGTPICGPSQDMDCRGANTPEEFTRQRDKIIAAITAIDADILGLSEIENNVNDEAVINLIDGLNAVNGVGTYDYVSTGVIGTDAIKVAFIYKPASVSLDGAYAILDSSVDARFIDTKNRPVLAQTFMDNATGGMVTLAINHLKSKGSDCNDVGDPDTGDGSGNCNITRTQAAQALVDWLASDPTGSGDSDFLIMGDLNSYDKEDPIDAIKAGSDDMQGSEDDYTDLVFQFQGEDAYSYVFDGQLGYLDHALASHDLVEEVTGVTDWHINADEPDLIDYDMTFKLDAQDALYAPDPYRSSDHDPVIIGLDLRFENKPKAATMTTITADLPDPSIPTQMVNVSVTVTSAFGLPTGNVQISGADANCLITLVGGSGSCNVVFTTAGYRTLKATYLGNATFATSTDTETHEVSAAATFQDVPNTYWAWPWIERLFAAGITAGCGTNPLVYCPETFVTRAEMAVFLERGLNGPAYVPPAATGVVFSDVPAIYWAAAWIEQLFADGITAGCKLNPLGYCPESDVTRAEMAVFLLRARYGAAYTPPSVGAGTGFGDVPITYWAAAWIKQLAAEGITAGCGAGNYCPDASVTRAEMAVFLVKTFDLP